MEQQQQSQLGLVGMILGIIGLLMTFMGCSFFPILMVAAILSGAAVFLGTAEKKKIETGEVDPQAGSMATVGQITGGIGCALQLLFVGLIVLFIGLYVVFFALMMVLSVAASL